MELRRSRRSVLMALFMLTCGVMVLYLAATGYQGSWYSPALLWGLGVAGTAFGLGLCIVRFRPFRFRVDEQGLTLRTGGVDATLPWSDVDAVLIEPDPEKKATTRVVVVPSTLAPLRALAKSHSQLDGRAAIAVAELDSLRGSGKGVAETLARYGGQRFVNVCDPDAPVVEPEMFTVTAPPYLPPSRSVIAAYPEMRPVITAVAAEDWQGVLTAIEDFADPMQRFEVATKMFLPLEQLEQLAREEPRILMRVMLASRHIDVGAAARTGNRAVDVTPEQFAAFHEELVRAERMLVDIVEQEPDNAHAWTLRLLTARGLELGISEAQRRYAELAKHHPHFYPAQSAMVQQLCPKWGGSWNAMHTFARECMLGAPDGGMSPAVVVEAHLEHWLLAEESAGVEYLRRPEVQTELDEAAARSVLHPAFGKPIGWVRTHGYFAFAYSLAGEYAKAEPHFRAMGNLASSTPWGYAGHPVLTFMQLRTKALQLP